MEWYLLPVDSLRSLMKLARATRPKRASAPALARAETALGRPLPEPLRSFYEQTDGLDLTTLGGLHLLSLAEVLEHRRGLAAWGVPDEWAYVPFAWCENSSDRFCVSAHPALDARVVWVPHDDGPAVAFPDLAHLLDAIAEACHRTADPLPSDDEDDDLFDLHALPRWYDEHQERSAADSAAALQLLDRYQARLRGDRDDVVAEQGAAFACKLLPPTHIATLVALLDALGPQARRYALERLRAIESEASTNALAGYRVAIAKLARRLEAAARTAGYDASFSPPDVTGEIHTLVVKARPKPLHYRVDHWYEHRDDRDLEARFARWLAERG